MIEALVNRQCSWIRFFNAFPDNRQERISQGFTERANELFLSYPFRMVSGNLVLLPPSHRVVIVLEAGKMHYVTTSRRDWTAHDISRRPSFANTLTVSHEFFSLGRLASNLLMILTRDSKRTNVFGRAV